MNEKDQLRATARAARAALSKDERRHASAQIEQRLLTAPQLAVLARWYVYVSYLNEVETHGLIQSLLARGTEVFVPLLVENEMMAAARLRSWEDLAPGKHGILTVAEPQAAIEPTSAKKVSPESTPDASLDVAIVPGLAFTPQGDRLGYGRGNYDRFFARCQVRWKVGLAFSSQIVDRVFGEPHDVPMDLVVTEREVYGGSRD